jgi:hypothetical protein
VVYAIDKAAIVSEEFGAHRCGLDLISVTSAGCSPTRRLVALESSRHASF